MMIQNDVRYSHISDEAVQGMLSEAERLMRGGLEVPEVSRMHWIAGIAGVLGTAAQVVMNHDHREKFNEMMDRIAVTALQAKENARD